MFQGEDMDRINKIIKNELYLEFIDKIKECEKSRIFCKHDPVHFMDVCRLAEIDWLNYRFKEMSDSQETRSASERSDLRYITREMLYACGLLHDIGRWQEYENGVSHEIASANLAWDILTDSGFDDEEVKRVTEAIRNHRNKAVAEDLTLSGFLYRADKKSRPCYLCEAESECNWFINKKNMEIK